MRTVEGAPRDSVAKLNLMPIIELILYYLTMHLEHWIVISLLVIYEMFFIQPVAVIKS